MVRYFSRGLVWLGFLGAMLVLGLGYLGGVHPAFDALAIGRIGAGVLAALLAPVAMGFRGWIAAGLILASLVPLVPFERGAPGGVSLYSKNLYFRNRDLAPIIADIRDVAPDIVVLQEVSTRHSMVQAELSAAYPHQFVCRTARWNGIAILSRFAIVDGSPACSPARAFTRVQVEGPEGPFWVVGLHLEWPWPKRQAQMVDLSMPMIEDLPGDVIVAGDFNTVPWSAVARQIGAATRTQPLAPRWTTFWLGWLPLPLDQVWAPCGGQVERRPRFSSDHHGMLARVFVGGCR